MQCTYCAEQIQDQAIVCRFCGAEKVDDAWVRLKPAAESSKSSFFFRSSGVLFSLSAVFELVSFTSPVALLGALREGPVAWLYHSVFAAIFLAIAIGLWRATWWGYRAVLAGTVFYTADKLLYLLDGATQKAVLSDQFKSHPELQQMIDPSSLEGPMQLATLAFVLGFWGFALMVHRRRSEFAPVKRPA